MSLNEHVTMTPTQGYFTLEDMGLTSNGPINNIEPVKDGVLSVQDADADKAVIQTDATGASGSTTTMTDSEIKKIPTWNTQIQVLSETSNKLVDMVDVQKDIEGAGVISQDRSDVIEATFESFYNDSNLRPMYTPFESKTNLGHAKDFMAKRVSATLENLLVQFNEIKTDGMTQMLKDMADLKEYCITEFRDELNDAINKITAITPRLLESSVILPFKSGEFIDMTCADLSKIDLDDIQPGVPLTEDFRRSFGMMVSIWNKDEHIKSTLSCLHQKYLQKNPGCQTPNNYEGLFVASIVCAFGNFTNDVMYGQFVDEATEKSFVLRGQIEDLDEELDSQDTPVLMIASKAAEMASTAQELATYQAKAKNIAQFASASAVVLANLVSLA